MTREEVAQLLAAASTVDPRMSQPGELVLRMWTGMLENIPMQAAEQALWHHYRHSRETIRPADIVEWHRERRRHEPERRERPPFDPDKIHAGVDRAIAALAERKAIAAGTDPGEAADIAEGEAGARRMVLSVPCTWPPCKAAVGSPCVGPDGSPLKKAAAHECREKAALAATDSYS